MTGPRLALMQVGVADYARLSDRIDGRITADLVTGARGIADGWESRPAVPAETPGEATPPPDALVWVSTLRRGVDRHRVGASGWTVCSRSTRTGHLLHPCEPWVVENTVPCPRCWPAGGAP